jgi:hypothetical protein
MRGRGVLCALAAYCIAYAVMTTQTSHSIAGYRISIYLDGKEGSERGVSIVHTAAAVEVRLAVLVLDDGFPRTQPRTPPGFQRGLLIKMPADRCGQGYLIH